MFRYLKESLQFDRVPSLNRSFTALNGPNIVVIEEKFRLFNCWPRMSIDTFELIVSIFHCLSTTQCTDAKSHL